MFISLILSGVGGLGQPETRKSSIHLRLMTDLAAAQEDVSHHNKILQGLDDLLRESIYITTCKEYSNHTNEELDLLNYKQLKETGYPLTSSMDEVERHLEDMLGVRLQLLNEQFTGPLPNPQIQQPDVSKLDEMMDEYQSIASSNNAKLSKLRELVARLKEAKGGKPEIDPNLIRQYNKTVSKNLMLADFITDLISSINTANYSQDEQLLNILLDCSDYNDYIQL